MESVAGTYNSSSVLSSRIQSTFLMLFVVVYCLHFLAKNLQCAHWPDSFAKSQFHLRREFSPNRKHGFSLFLRRVPANHDSYSKKKTESFDNYYFKINFIVTIYVLQLADVGPRCHDKWLFGCIGNFPRGLYQPCPESFLLAGSWWEWTSLSKSQKPSLFLIIIF